MAPDACSDPSKSCLKLVCAGMITLSQHAAILAAKCLCKKTSIRNFITFHEMKASVSWILVYSSLMRMFRFLIILLSEYYFKICYVCIHH